MFNITHNNTAVYAEELGMVAADGRTKANDHFKCRAMGAVTAQLHGSCVARTIPGWNRLPAAAADQCSISNIVPLEIECTTGQLLAVWSARYAVGRHSTAGKRRFCRVPTRQNNRQTSRRVHGCIFYSVIIILCLPYIHTSWGLSFTLLSSGAAQEARKPLTHKSAHFVCFIF